MGICLDNRLVAVARWVQSGQVMADIGTDHAYLPCWLVLNGVCPKAIATDVAEGPYLRALQTVTDLDLRAKVDIRLGPGLKVLGRGEAATIVMAGMGGRLICELLQADMEKAAAASRLILQAQREPELVRSWLIGHGWRIIGDDLARDGKMWYNIIIAERGAMTLDEDHLLYGITEGVDPKLRREWLSFRADGIQEIVTALKDAPGTAAIERQRELKQEADRLKRLIAEVAIC